jgi:DNA-binding CsgD family transcriptional regulator/tetratricopeptide (TPR) repeat protein
MGMRLTSAVTIGREDEVAALEAALAARAERPVVLVGGEAGVGKTRLVRELEARARTQGAMTALGSCAELGADVLPYAPFVESLDRLCEDLGPRAEAVLGPRRAELAALVPALATSADGAGGAAVAAPGAASRGRLYEAVRTLLDGGPDPLVLILEDFHWADASSLELLAYLARRLRAGRTLVVATYRTDELRRRHPLVPVLAELERSGYAARLEVARLDPAVAARLVEVVRADASPDLVRDVVARSEGIPFLIEELAAAGARPGSPLPRNLRDVLLARLASLDEATRAVLGVVAVSGRPVDQELIAAVSAIPVDEALREALDRSLLVADPASGRFWFRHALLAEAVSDDLLPGERVALHATLARVLADRPDLASPSPAGAAAELAHHLLEAKDLPAALGAAVVAGRAASAARAYAEARSLYERGLELFERLDDAESRAGVDLVGLLDLAAEASFHAGDAERAVALGRRAVAVAEAATPQTSTARVGSLLVRLIEWSEEVGDFEALVRFAERAVALVPDDPPSPERAFALIGLAAARLHESRNLDLERLASEAIGVAAACSETGYEAIARSMRGAALAGLARDDEAIAEVDAAFALSEVSNGTEEVTIVSANRVAVFGYLGHLERLPSALAEARIALDREGSLTLNEPFLDCWQAAMLLCEGRASDADEVLSRHIDRLGARPVTLADLLGYRGRVRIIRGLLDEGEADLRAALDLRPRIHAESIAECCAWLADCAVQRGDPRAALAWTEAGSASLDPTDEVTRRARIDAGALRIVAEWTERSRARRTGGLPPEVASARRRAAERLQAALEGRLVVGGGVDDYVRAMAAWGFAEEARCEGRSDPDAWAAAAAGLAGVGEADVSAYCRLREAESVLELGGDRRRAAATILEARAWAARAEAAPLLEALDSLARRARLDVGSLPDDGPGVAQAAVPGPEDPFGLSPREREVLALLVDGRTNREIGDTLFISEKTASVHVTHILDKLGVSSRGAAAARAVRAGLIGPAGEA